MQICALGCIKLSILFLYRRIFCTSKDVIFNLVIIISIIIVYAWTVSFFFAFIFTCGSSVDAHWGNLINVLTKCGDVGVLDIQLGLAVSDFIMDCIILITPVPMV
jgi:hypothetical protein